MKIKMKKIRRHWWFPFMIKDVVFEITTNDDVVYEQVMCNDWEMSINNKNMLYINANYEE